jgi:uncharacterized protein (TIGR02145 family)
MSGKIHNFTLQFTLLSSMSPIRPASVLIFCLLNTLTFAQTDVKRIALVIGVKNYTHIPPLKNTLNDAHDMSATLKGKGFQVVELYDPQTKRQMQDAIRSYFDLLQGNPNCAGMVFYSGHGMQVDGSNYLIPVTANPQIKADLEDQCLNMDYVMRAIEQAGNPLNIFILDACRNNPFKGFYRSAEQGLNMVSSPKGSYIVFATKPGSVASDGNGGNGLFTSKLLKYLNAEGLNIEQVFKKVAADVATESNDSQRPWIASDYTGDFYFTPGSISTAPATAVTFVPQPTSYAESRGPEMIGVDLGYEDVGGTKVILIDQQQWASKNLNSDHFANGKKIAEAKSEDEWRNADKNSIPAWCYFNNDPGNGAIYGKLYNWHAVQDLRKLCPAGWHVPADTDWEVLGNFAGPGSAGKLKSSEEWSMGKNGSDVYEFTALPAASRGFKGKFTLLNEDAYWWSNTEEGSNIYWALYRNINYKGTDLFKSFISKGSGLSVRCLKD